MSERDAVVLISDMHEAVERIREYTEGISLPAVISRKSPKRR